MKKILVTILLISLLGINFNFFYYSHTHIDADGHVTVHAHPFNKEAESGKTSHSHTNIDFLLFGILYQLFTHFYGLVFLGFVFILFFRKLKSCLSLLRIFSQHINQSISRRGPPAVFSHI